MTAGNNIKNRFSSEEFAKMNSEEKILKMSSEFRTPSGKAENEVLDSILTRMEKTTPARTIKLKHIFQAAAAFLILFLSVYSANTLLVKNHKTTQLAENAEITLPDHTTVNLNADSKLTWNNKKFTQKREVTLQGEAFFDVKKGNEFIIKTKNGSIEILGTQLNVYARNNNFWVSCLEGKVRVVSNHSEQIITPGERVSLNESGLVKSIAEHIDNTASWKNGTFYFENKPLTVIFAELERQFDVSVKLRGNSNRLATTVFSNKNLKEALDVVCIPMELSYEIKNKKIIVQEKQ